MGVKFAKGVRSRKSASELGKSEFVKIIKTEPFCDGDLHVRSRSKNPASESEELYTCFSKVSNDYGLRSTITESSRSDKLGNIKEYSEGAPSHDDALHVRSMISENSGSESEDLYSEETTRCVMSISSSSSSGSEDAGSATEEIPDITADGIPQHDGHGDSNVLKTKYPQLYNQLTGVCRRLNAVVYISKSFLQIWQKSPSSIRVPNDVIFDAVILSPLRPVTFLTFSINGGDKITKYNSKAARCLITSVRESLFPSFSVVNGVVDMETRQSEESFHDHLDNLESQARVFSVDAWLAMDSEKHDKLVTFFVTLSRPAQNISDISELNSLPSYQLIRALRQGEERSDLIKLLQEGPIDLQQQVLVQQKQISDQQKQISDVQKQISDQQHHITDQYNQFFNQRQRSDLSFLGTVMVIFCVIYFIHIVSPIDVQRLISCLISFRSK